MKNDVSCPYCGKDQEINHDDGYGYAEDEVHNQQCDSCEKYFTYTTFVTYIYNAEKADCLNGAPHNWKPTHTYPREYARMRCSICDEHRSPTAKEKIMYNIPEIEGKK